MRKAFSLFILIALLAGRSIAQTSVCEPNMDFELGNYSVWTYFAGTCCPSGNPVTNTPVATPTPPRFNIMTGTGSDACCSFPVVGQGIYSLKLGAANVSNSMAERARYYVHIPAGSTGYSLVYRYAFVMEDPNHGAATNPRFNITFTDSATGAVIPFASYSFVAGSVTGTYPGSCAPLTSPKLCKPWTTQHVNLSAYSGSTVIMDVVAAACGQGGHFAYGYFDMSCGLFAITNHAVCGSTLLVAPSGFASYSWYDSSTYTILYGVNDSVYVSPTMTTTYALIVTPNPGYGSADTLYTTVFPGSGTGMPPITGNKTICLGSTTTLSNATAGGTWSSVIPAVATVAATGIVSGVSLGTSVISYSAGPGCVATTTVTVVPSTGPVTGMTQVCTGATIALSNTSGGGSWSSGAPGIATVGGSGVVTGVNAGSVLITYTGVCGMDTLRITVNQGPSTISGNTSMCRGSSTTLSNAIAGGTWSSSNIGVASVSGGSTLDGVGVGSAVVTYMMPGGCYRTATVTVSQPPSVISGSMIVCAGATINLSNTVAGGTWTSATPGIATVIAATGVVTGAAPGNAVISYTTSGGTGCTATTTVTVGPGPSAISGNTSLCLGSSTTLSNTVAGGTWSSSNSSIASVSSGSTVDGVGAGSAVVTYMMPGGCYRTASVTVGMPPSVISGMQSVCSGLAIALSNTVTGGTWISASPGVATVTPSGAVTGVAAGTAVISYATSGGAGCTMTTTVTVNAGPGPVTGNTSICLGSATTLGNVMAGGTWSSANITVATVSGNTVTGAGAGGAVITYMVAGGCYRTATVTVSQPPSAISGSTTVCAFAAIALGNTVAGGTWTSAAPAVATVHVSTGTVTGVSPGTAVITYATASGGACMATTTITVFPAPSAGTIVGPGAVCVGSSIALTDMENGGTWSSSSGGVATVSESGIVTGISAGAATISYTINTLCGPASATATVTVTAIPAVASITGPGNVCTGESVSLSDVTTGGVWSSSNSNATVAGGAVTGLAAGTVTISYIVTNSCGADTATKTISVYQTPAAGSIGGPDFVCAGAVFTMTATVAGGAWTSSDVFATINNVTGEVRALSQGTAIISYTTTLAGSSCTGLATYTLTVIPVTFTIQAAITQVNCYGENNGSISVHVNSGVGVYNYLWSTGSSAAAITGLSPGMYTLNVRELATQCIADTTFTISQPDSLYATDSVLRDVCLQGTGAIYITPHGGVPSYSYHWSAGAATYALENLHSGIYTVTVTDLNNCTVTLQPEVTDSVCTAIIIHNAVTPNGDGINDTWVIEGIEGYAASTVSVFDKWGDKVFEQTNYKNDWYARGLPDGTYYYLVKLNATNLTGGEDTFTGALLIKR